MIFVFVVLLVTIAAVLAIAGVTVGAGLFGLLALGCVVYGVANTPKA